MAGEPPVIYEVLAGGPWLCFFHTGQASAALHAPTSSANCCLITDSWVSQSIPSQFKGKGQIQIQNPAQRLHSFLSMEFLFFFFWKGLGEGWIQPYSRMEVLLNTGAPKGKQENVNTLHCLKIPELWGHQLSALHKVQSCEQTVTAKIQKLSIFCMPFSIFPLCCQALQLSYGVINSRKK